MRARPRRRAQAARIGRSRRDASDDLGGDDHRPRTPCPSTRRQAVAVRGDLARIAELRDQRVRWPRRSQASRRPRQHGTEPDPGQQQVMDDPAPKQRVAQHAQKDPGACRVRPACSRPRRRLDQIRPRTTGGRSMRQARDGERRARNRSGNASARQHQQGDAIVSRQPAAMATNCAAKASASGAPPGGAQPVPVGADRARAGSGAVKASASALPISAQEPEAFAT